MVNQRIDISEKWLAFECSKCGRRSAKDVNLVTLVCPHCGGYLVQLTRSDILRYSWDDYILNPFYIPGNPKLGFSIIMIFLMLLTIVLWWIYG